MSKTVSIIRLAILLTLSGLAITAILAVPTIANAAAWFPLLILSKAIGVAAGWTAVRLYRTWAPIDPLLRAYDRLTGEPR